MRRNSMNRFILFCQIFWFGLTVHAQNNDNIASDIDTLRFHYATASEARTLWLEEDAYKRNLSKFDLNVRVGHNGATMKDLEQKAFRGFHDWTKAEKERMDSLMCKLNEIIRKENYKLPLPDSIIIVKSDMEDEGGAGGYTRSKWIALQSDIPLKYPEIKLIHIMLHELFHVLTRNNLDFKRNMYAQIGFTVLDYEIEFPKDLKDVRISNPDVDRMDSYAIFKVDSVIEPQRCAMVLYANKPYAGGTLFQYINVGFIALDQNLKPIMSNGKTLVYSTKQITDFTDKVGENTRYMINPEEILADNFSFSFMRWEHGMKTPSLCEKLRSVMMKTEK